MGFLSRDKKKVKSNNKEIIENLKKNIDKENRKVLNEGFYEWKIKNWNQLLEKESSPIFNIGNYNWKLQLNTNKTKNNDNVEDNNEEYISIHLNNLDVRNSDLYHISSKFVIYIRNYYDTSSVYYGDALYNNYNKDSFCYGSEKFAKKSKLLINNENSNKTIIENNRCIIGVYLVIYEYEEEYCINEIKGYINDENHEVLNEGMYEWKIKNLKEFLVSSSNDKNSPEFNICGYNWRLKIKNKNICLKNLDVENDQSVHICSKFIFYIRNENDYSRYSYDDFYAQCFRYFNKDTVIYNNQHNNILDLININKKSNKNINEDYKITIGVYIRTYNIEQCMDELYPLIKYYGYSKEITSEFFEWEIDNWNQLSDEEYSPEFSINNQRWKLILLKDNNDDSISIHLKSVDIENYPSTHIFIKTVLYIRNYNDFSYLYYQALKGDKSTIYCNKKNNPVKFNHFIKTSDLFSKNETLNKSLIENNKCVIGVYLCTSIYTKDQYKSELKEIFDDENRSIESETFYEWKIEDWNQLHNEEFSTKFISKSIYFGNHKWILNLYPNGNGEENSDYVSLYLKNMDDDNFKDTTISTKCILFIRNYDDTLCYAYEELPLTYYNKTYNVSGFHKFIKRSELFTNNGFLNKPIVEFNKCIIGVLLHTYKNNIKVNKEFTNLLKNNMTDENDYILEQKLHEFEINDWDRDSCNEYNIKFIIGNYKWELDILSNDLNNSIVNVNLKNLDVEEDDSINICTKCVIFIRNYYDYSCYYAKRYINSYVYFNKNNNSLSFEVDKPSLFDKGELFYKSIIAYGKCIVGVHICIYGNNNVNEVIEEKNDIMIFEKEKVKDISYNNLSTPSLVIALSNFTAYEYDQLDIRKDEFLIVTNWNYKDGWVYGYRKNNEKEKGLFPKVFIKICKNESEDSATHKRKIITPEYRINFENKVEKLRTWNEMRLRNSETHIVINRNKLFSDAFDNIMSKSPIELKSRLKIKYEGEEGIDAGGLLRDFFYQLSKEIGNPNYSLFRYSHDNSYELEINPKSGISDPNHLLYFKFIGRIMGLAILYKQYLSISFSLLFYKKLLNKKLQFSDLEYVDPEIYKNINWLRENEGAENLCLTFEIEENDCFDNHEKIELKPNGSAIDVTDANKHEYIDLIVKNKLYNTNDEEQLNAVKEGFYEIIPRRINTLFDELDLKYLISGINEINIDDWEENTDYEGYNKNDITIVNFWKCVREFDNDKQIQLLIFATGNSQVPVTGFKDLQGSGKIQHFKLKKAGTEDDLPKSHTCFNRVDLPPYTSYTQLKQKLLRALAEGISGFEIQ